MAEGFLSLHIISCCLQGSEEVMRTQQRGLLGRVTASPVRLWHRGEQGWCGETRGLTVCVAWRHREGCIWLMLICFSPKLNWFMMTQIAGVHCVEEKNLLLVFVVP